MKDRMALALIEAAERDGRLKSRGAVVEYTGGSTGVSLAFICPAKLIRCTSSSLRRRDRFAQDRWRRRRLCRAVWHDRVADDKARLDWRSSRNGVSSRARGSSLRGNVDSANVLAAQRCASPRLAERLGPGVVIVTVMCDTGMKYLRTFGAQIAG